MDFVRPQHGARLRWEEAKRGSAAGERHGVAERAPGRKHPEELRIASV